ncbi:nuclear transport factor 2 family protein [Amnibacterium kyonggiense]
MNDERRTTAPTAASSIALWMEMWNTGGAIALHICSDDFRIHFGTSEPDGSNPGDSVRGAESFSRFLDWYREHHAGVVFTERRRAVDGLHGRMLWDVEARGRRVGGIDVFDFTSEGLIREVWSVTGSRSLVD